MLILVANKIQEAQIPEIWEIEEEKSLSLGQLKYDCLKYAKQNFQGKTFVNMNILKPIRVSQDGLMEWWKKSRKREHIISVKLLEFFLENSIFKEENPDYLERRKIESASRFECDCKINGKSFIAVITTRKAVNDIDKFRYLSLKNVELVPK
jgi:hypothetical protein